MPIIRDYTQAYHATTTYKHLEIPMPNYVSGDLLIAILTTDTGTPTLIGGMPLKACKYDDGGAFTDYTVEANNSTAADFYPVPATPATNDAIYFGSDVPFNQLNIIGSTQGAGTWTNVFEYYSSVGPGWVDCADTDGTTSFKAVVTVHQAVTWTPSVNWIKCTIDNVEAYYLRSRVSAYTSISTRPILSQAHVIPVNTRLNGWNALFAYNGGQSNEAGIGVAWRIATETEVDTTIYYSNAETSNGAIISCRDTDLSVSTVINEFTGAATANIEVDASERTYTRSDVGGSFTTDGFVAGMTIRMTGFTQAGNNTTKTIESVTATVITVTDGTGLQDESGGGGNERIWSSPFNTTAIYSAISRAAANNTDGLGTGKGYMPSMTTDRDNCLLFYVYTITAAGVPSIIEGACQLGAAKDGSAHADAWSWGFKATAGATSSTVIRNHMGALVAGSLVFAVNPPTSTGALVIPGYTASDASVYVSPFTGAAYNGDTATSTNTIATGFTGTINGKVLSNGTTTVTRADAGINSYHAMHNTGGIVTPGRWAGNRTVIVGRTTLASKNILFHIQPYLPIDIQTTDSVSLLGVMGYAIGLATSDGNFRVWHVGGANTGWGTQRHQPCVINTDYAVTVANDGGLIQDTGAFNDDSITQIGIMVSGKVVAANWMTGSIWALDTCVIVGGSVAEPLDIEQTVRAYADGHERRSAIRQGSGQMLLLGPIQYGDGGTNPIYLELDSTAIEFPRIYDKAKKEVYYNSVANFAGITYKAGPLDTIIHKNSVISSPSQFKWELDAASNVGATYDFSGLSVIGAGTISLARAITGGLTGLTINGYATLDISGLNLKNSTILNVPTGNDKLTTSSTTDVEYCSIDVSNLAAGTRWCSVANPEIFENCTFQGKVTTNNAGYAIRITDTGSFDFVGNTFTDFGANDSTSAAILNDSGGLVTLTISGTSSVPTITNGVGADTDIIMNPVDTTITVKDINTGAAIESARVLVEVANNDNFPYQASVTISRSGSTATVTHAGHKLATGNKVRISGATQTEYNGVKSITYIGVDSYSFTVSGTPDTPATGTITATMVIIDAATNASGIVTDNRSLTASQLITGRVRRFTAGAYYKTAPITGTISSTTGLSVTIQLIPDT